MRNRLVIILALVIATFAVGTVGAQELVFFEGDVRISEIVDSGEPFVYRSEDIYFGFQLGPNFVVATGPASYAEVVLPNGHVLKLAEDTEVVLENVVARAQTGEDRVAVSRGRLRSVVAGLTGTGRAFAVRTPTAVGGVRGTDFVTQVLLGAQGISEEAVAVLEGVVDFSRDDGQSVSVLAGQFANALAASFQAQTADIASQFYGGLSELSEQTQAAAQQILDSLPPPDDADSDEPATEEEPPADDQEGQADDDDDVVNVGSTTPPVDTQEPAAGGGEESEPEGAGGGGPVDQFIADLTEALGVEIGTITLEGETFSKVIAQPTFRLGKLRAGLYLPVIYRTNMFDPSDWYRPKGNNEWSFGFDQDWAGTPLVALGDLVGDLALKIKFLEWGQQRDPFFFKVGNLNTLTLGHGLLMRNYANDTDFPVIRRVGFNLGVDQGRLGFEAIVNDLAAPEVFGARVFARPLANFPMAIGLSGAADIGPARDLPEAPDLDDPVLEAEIANARTADPIFVNVALDLDLPVFEREAASLILFGDVGGLLPYLRAPVAGIEQGFRVDALWYDPGTGNELRNYGIAAGLFGNISIFDYRLEFRNFHGIFQPAFYNSNYDRVRGEKATDTIRYLADPSLPQYEHETIGVYGEAGFSIAELVRLEAGYFWPWTRDPATDEIEVGENDYLLASLVVEEGLLPLGISAGVKYERTDFIPTLNGNLANATLFDANTVFRGEIIYPVAPIMDIVLAVSTSVLSDADGNLVLDPATGRPDYSLVWNIETRLGGDIFE
jgi:hypothetical protein